MTIGKRGSGIQLAVIDGTSWPGTQRAASAAAAWVSRDTSPISYAWLGSVFTAATPAQRGLLHAEQVSAARFCTRSQLCSHVQCGAAPTLVLCQGPTRVWLHTRHQLRRGSEGEKSQRTDLYVGDHPAAEGGAVTPDAQRVDAALAPGTQKSGYTGLSRTPKTGVTQVHQLTT